MKPIIYLTAITFFNFILVAQNSQIATTSLIPLTPCDERYATEVQLALDRLPENSAANISAVAREYVIMLKQHYDLGMKISQIENDVLNTALITILRVPLSNYASCTTKTSPIAQDTSVTVEPLGEIGAAS